MIRTFTPDDVHAFARVVAESPEAAQWTAAALLSCASPIVLLVSEHAGEVVGFAAFRVVRDEAEILNLAVLPASRRRGAGTDLVREVLAQSAVLGAKHVFLEVRESNAAARAFYSDMGFADAGVRRGYYSNPVENAILMSRITA